MTYYKLCNNFRLQSSFGVDWGCKKGKKKTHGQVILRNYYYLLDGYLFRYTLFINIWSHKGFFEKHMATGI